MNVVLKTEKLKLITLNQKVISRKNDNRIGMLVPLSIPYDDNFENKVCKLNFKLNNDYYGIKKHKPLIWNLVRLIQGRFDYAFIPLEENIQNHEME